MTSLVQITTALEWTAEIAFSSVCVSTLAPTAYFTQSGQNDPFKNQVSLCSTPSHGFLFQGHIHHGLLVYRIWLPETSNLFSYHSAITISLHHSSNKTSMLQPQGLCTCCSLRLKCTSTSFCTLSFSLPSGLSAYPC